MFPAPTHTTASELDRIFSHTRWQLRVVHSVRGALEAVRNVPALWFCEHRLPDGTWLDVVRETEQLCPRPQTIVLSASADARLWAEVLNCGGYDLLAKPLKPRDLYALIPAAWRQWNNEAEKDFDVQDCDGELDRC